MNVPAGYIQVRPGVWEKPKGAIAFITSDVAGAAAPTYEADLHADIISECRKRGWIYFHGAMNQRTARTIGEPDFTILADQGRVLLVECKRPGGKLSTEQLGIIQWAAKLGHKIHTVWAINEFLEIVNVDKTPNPV